MLTPDDLEAFLGLPVDPVQAEAHLGTVTAFARAYTRGRGFTDGEPTEEIAAVILTATTRLLTNPTGTISQSTGPFNIRPGSFHGWNIVETLVLNSYRQRAM